MRSSGLLLLHASLLLAQSGASSSYRGGLVTPPLSKPAFVLTDTSGASYDFQKRTDRSVTLLFFGYTSCPDQCPMHMASLGAALHKLPSSLAAQIKLVFVTTDPARDTPTVLRRWLDYFDKSAVGLTGTPVALAAVQRAAGVPPARQIPDGHGSYSVAHANFVVAYTKDNLAHVIYPGGVTKDDWIHDLPLLIQETWSRP